MMMKEIEAHMTQRNQELGIGGEEEYEQREPNRREGRDTLHLQSYSHPGPVEHALMLYQCDQIPVPGSYNREGSSSRYSSPHQDVRGQEGPARGRDRARVDQVSQSAASAEKYQKECYFFRTFFVLLELSFSKPKNLRFTYDYQVRGSERGPYSNNNSREGSHRDTPPNIEGSKDVREGSYSKKSPAPGSSQEEREAKP